MNRKDIADALARGMAVLRSFIPDEAGLHFPVLYAACVWAGRRVFNYRDHLLNWRIWLDPETAGRRPDASILAFFNGDEALRSLYSQEIGSGDFSALRRAFRALYPVWGLGDAFLQGLFRKDLAGRDFRRISAEFESVAGRAWENIRPIEANRDFWEFLEGLGIEIASLGIHLLDDEAVRNLVTEALEAKSEAGGGVRKED